VLECTLTLLECWLGDRKEKLTLLYLRILQSLKLLQNRLDRNYKNNMTVICHKFVEINGFLILKNNTHERKVGQLKQQDTV